MHDDKANQGPVTLHLAPLAVWNSQSGGRAYVPEAFQREGFIHCTDGDGRVIEVGNRYYRDDARPYCVLTIAVERLAAPVRYEDPDGVYPHIYGPLNVDAVVKVRRVERGAGGEFVAIGDQMQRP